MPDCKNSQKQNNLTYLEAQKLRKNTKSEQVDKM